MSHELGSHIASRLAPLPARLEATSIHRPLQSDQKRCKIQLTAHAVVSLGLGSLLLLGSPSMATDAGGAQLFAKNCAGCHAGGGNIVQRSATLKLDDLKTNDAATPDQIYSLIYSGKGKMPGYGMNCAPKGKCTFAARLSDDVINSLTKYVLDQAAEGWQQ